MNEKKKNQLPERNPDTHAAHRREVFWQVTLPVSVTVLILLFLVVSVMIAGFRGYPGLRRWADISLAWLLAPAIALSLLFLILNAVFVYVFSRLLKVLPGFARLVHNYVLLVQYKVGQVTDRLVQPFIKGHSLLAGLRALRKR